MHRYLLNRAPTGRSGAAFRPKSDSDRRRSSCRLAASPNDDPSPQKQKKKKRQGMDELLDFMIAGPKLRKWYGESDEMEASAAGGGGGDFDGLPRDGDRGEAAATTTEATAATATALTSSSAPSSPSSSPSPSSSALPPAPEGTRDAVVVVSADGGPVAEAVLLQLILARGEAEEDPGFFGGEFEGEGLFDDELLIVPPENGGNGENDDDDDDFEPAIDFEPRPKTFLVPLVKDCEAALSSFGKYAVPIDERDEESVRTVLKRASAVVVAGGGWEKVLKLLLEEQESSSATTPPHLVALIGDGQNGGGLAGLLAGLGGGMGSKKEASAVADPKREAALRSSFSSSGSVPLTLVRAVGGVRDAPGGVSLIVVGGEAGASSSSKRPVAAGDAAAALAAAALLPEISSSSLIEFSICDAGPGDPSGDWAVVVSDAVVAASSSKK